MPERGPQDEGGSATVEGIRSGGLRVGHYEFVRQIGSGGMGDVFLARDLRLDRQVAIKLIRRELLGDQLARGRFIREARLASSVVHPYVATVFDVLEEGDETYLVMEYVEGERLDHLLAGPPIPLERRLRIAGEIGEALSAIHGKGLIHRDLKPGNVIVTPAGHAKVLDFGLARSVAPLLTQVGSNQGTLTGQEALTSPGALVGTVAYMSPEQIRGEESDTRSDIFSLGVILYQLATGVHPFLRHSLVETASAILSDAPGRATEPALAATMPLKQILSRALAKSRQDRYGSAASFVEELNVLVRGGALPAPRVTLKRNRLRLALVLSAALVFVAGSSVAAYRLLHSPPPWNKPRVAVACIPFADRTGQAEGGLRALMVADLLATNLESSRLVRTVGPGQTVPLLVGLRADATGGDIARRVALGMRVDYVLTGNLYREGESYLATIDVVPVSGGPVFTSVRAEARTASALAEKLAGSLKHSLPGVPVLTAWRDGAMDVSILTSSSEEARLLYERGLLAWRDGKLGEAIGWLEKAVQEDPAFAIAHATLASVLNDAGYGQRARESASRALSFAPSSGSPAAERLALTLRAVRAQVFSSKDEFTEAAGKLASLYRDEPEVLQMHASALEAAGKYTDALFVLDRAIVLDQARPGLHLMRGELLTRMEKYDQALASIAEAERLYKLLDSKEGLALVSQRRGEVFSQEERFDPAVEEFARAAEGFRSAGREPLAAEALMLGAKVDTLKGDASAAKRRLEEVAGTAQSLGNIGLLCRVRSSQGARLYLQGDWEGGEGRLREAVDLARQLQNDRLLLEPLSNLASLLGYTGRFQESRQAAEEALALATALDSKHVEANARILLATLDYQQGDIERAIHAFEEIEKDARPSPDANAAWALEELAWLHRNRGRMDLAMQASNQAVEAFKRLSVTGYAGYALLQRAWLLAVLGQAEASRRDLDEARKIATSPGAGLEDLAAQCVLTRAEVLCWQGRWWEARQEAERTLVMRGAKVPGIVAGARTVLCEALIGPGQNKSAIARCRSVTQDAASPAMDRVAALAILAEALRAAGHHREALDEAEKALQEAERMGLLLPAARAAATLVSLPSPFRPANAESIRKRGAQALASFIAFAPEESRGALVSLGPIARLRKILETTTLSSSSTSGLPSGSGNASQKGGTPCLDQKS